jgi:hypothetical protein
MARRTRSARVAARAKAGNGVRRTATGTKAPKVQDVLDEEDQDGDDEDPEDEEDQDQDGDDEDPEDEEDQDGDDEDDTDPETEFLAGLTKEQAKFYNDSSTTLKAKLTKANANARKHRLARAALQAGGTGTGSGTGTGTGTQPPKPGPAKKDGPVDQAALLTQLKSEMQAEADQKELVRTAAEALVEAGLVLPTDKVARRRALNKAVRMLELDGADVDDVDDEVDALKAEMPGLFKAPRRKPAAGPGGPKKATGSKSTLGGALDKLFG